MTADHSLLLVFISIYFLEKLIQFLLFFLQTNNMRFRNSIYYLYLNLIYYDAKLFVLISCLMFRCFLFGGVLLCGYPSVCLLLTNLSSVTRRWTLICSRDAHPKERLKWLIWGFAGVKMISFQRRASWLWYWWMSVWQNVAANSILL